MDDTEFNQTNIANASFSNQTDYHLIPNFSNLTPYVLLSVSGTCANLLVIICIVRNKKLHRPANYYIASLCANNIAISLFSLNGTAIFNTFYGWPFGLGLCRVSLMKYTTSDFCKQ
jgi:7 transmembrane receptor (rhodopsin family)